MKVRFPIVFLSVLALAMTASYLEAQSRPTGLFSGRADGIQNQRVEMQRWTQTESNSQFNRTFALEEWDKHFSPLGSRRAPIAMSEGRDKQMFETRVLNRDMVDFEISEWNEKMKNLHRAAGIEMDDQAQLVADQRLYSMMLQDTIQFREMAEEVSLRDLNRYQFRRNRTDDGIPVEQAGSGN